LTSTLIVTSKNEELFTREIDIGGHKINLEIMNLKNVSYKEAEIEKNQKGISVFNSDSENDESEIQISTRNIYSELSDEIRKSLRYYMKSKNSISYNNFYISGGMSETPGLIKFLNESLNVDFLLFNSFLKVNQSKKVVNSAKYSVALGLALRGTLIDNTKKKRSLPFNGISTKIKDFLINPIKE
jgi:Tfp pilus assembly PilM family ATPase